MHDEQEAQELNLGGGHSYEVNSEGYLLLFQHHDDRWVAHFAKEEGYKRGATKDMKQAIRAARACFERKGSMPTLAEIAAEAEFKVMHLFELFPSGPARMLPLIAGLPCAIEDQKA